jgi:site-specific recombinase XerD
VKCRAAKSFFRYLTESGVLAQDPAVVLHSPSTKGVLPKQAPRHDEVRRLLEMPSAKTKQGLRDRAALELAYSSGLRVGELEALSLFDVDLQGGLVAVRQGKGRKDRLCPIGVHACRALRDYLDRSRPVYRQASPAETEAFFLNNRGQRWDRQDIRRVLRHYRMKAGLPDTLTPHGLRRGMATGMISRLQKLGKGESADLTVVSAILGHTRLEVTARYAQVLTEDLQDVHGKTHPRNRTTEAFDDAVPVIRGFK